MTNQIQTKLRKKLASLKASKGFSLVELLVVIAVIGIIAAIAIPNIAGITGNAEIAKSQRNAQSLASTFAAARAAGCDTDVQTAAAAVTAVVGGTLTFPATSSYTGANFKVPGLDAGQQTAALTHLAIANPGTSSGLEYTP